MEFVDKREMIKAKKRAGKPDRKPVEEMSDDDDEEMDDAELEAELAKDLEEDKEAKNPDLLDETVFNKFATGELDLPEDEAELELSDDEADEAAAAEDSELEAYYEELGIDVTEMHDKRVKKGEDALYKKQKKSDVRKEQIQEARRERNQILDSMMQKARDEPSIKTLMRIIQVVKAVFADKIEQDQKKKGGKEAEDEEMADQEESKARKQTPAQIHKKFS